MNNRGFHPIWRDVISSLLPYRAFIHLYVDSLAETEEKSFLAESMYPFCQVEDQRVIQCLKSLGHEGVQKLQILLDKKVSKDVETDFVGSVEQFYATYSARAGEYANLSCCIQGAPFPWLMKTLKSIYIAVQEKSGCEGWPELWGRLKQETPFFRDPCYSETRKNIINKMIREIFLPFFRNTWKKIVFKQESELKQEIISFLGEKEKGGFYDLLVSFWKIKCDFDNIIKFRAVRAVIFGAARCFVHLSDLKRNNKIPFLHLEQHDSLIHTIKSFEEQVSASIPEEVDTDGFLDTLENVKGNDLIYFLADFPATGRFFQSNTENIRLSYETVKDDREKELDNFAVQQEEILCISKLLKNLQRADEKALGSDQNRETFRLDAPDGSADERVMGSPPVSLGSSPVSFYRRPSGSPPGQPKTDISPATPKQPSRRIEAKH
ncbi:MAG: hypothetical protein ACD_60C00097G0007 [uncultured bacterium]|nr:MAG: hypothetical protein ACD_60C00097G0007 [uncultured bacterium]